MAEENNAPKQQLTQDNVDQFIVQFFEELLLDYRDDKFPDESFQNPEYIQHFDNLALGINKQEALNSTHRPGTRLHPLHLLDNFDLDYSQYDELAVGKLKASSSNMMAFFQNITALRLNGGIAAAEDAIEKELSKYKAKVLDGVGAGTSPNTIDLETLAAVITAKAAPDEDDTKKETFAEVADGYLEWRLSKTSKSAAKPQTVEEDYRPKVEVIKLLLGDKVMSKINKKDIVEAKNCLDRLPKKMTDLKLDDGVTHVDVLRNKNHGYPLVSGSVASKYKMQLKAICKYAYQEDFCNKNPAEGVEFDYTKEQDKVRLPFSSEDLENIFNGWLYKQQENAGKHKPSMEHFWVPLIALYTGARPGEILQLRLDDIKFDEECQCRYFDITDEAEGQTTKTEGSKRKVPFHSELINLGIESFIKEQIQISSDWLFSGLDHTNSKRRGRKFGQWFNRDEKGKRRKVGYLVGSGVDKSCGDSSGKKKDFYSMRHTFIDNLKQQDDMDVYKIADLVGHEDGLPKLQTLKYGNKYGMNVKINTMERVKYKLDLSHVSWDDFKKRL